jgi:hypothetical protein
VKVWIFKGEILSKAGAERDHVIGSGISSQAPSGPSGPSTPSGSALPRPAAAAGTR